MRVLHVDSATEWRGGQVQLAHLLGPDDLLLAPAGAPLHDRVPSMEYGIRALFMSLQTFRPDLIAAHTSRAHGLAVLQRQVPVVVHRRVDFPPRPSSRLKYALPAGFIAVSDAVRAVLVASGVHPARVRVVPDGIAEPPALPPLPRPGGVLALAVGALVPHKGHRTLIDAAAKGGFEAWIAGDGPERPALEARIAATGARVRLLGSRDDVPALLATADVFVHPSHEEGLGQVLLEARALGCRIVAARAGGAPEAAGPDALLVPPRDPGALARAVVLAATCAPPAPRLLPAHRVPAMVAATRVVYRELVARS